MRPRELPLRPSEVRRRSSGRNLCLLRSGNKGRLRGGADDPHWKL